MKTPPAKQDEKEITRRHLEIKDIEQVQQKGFLHNLILDVTSGLFLNCENSLRGSMPKRKVATAIENRVITCRYLSHM